MTYILCTAVLVGVSMTKFFHLLLSRNSADCLISFSVDPVYVLNMPCYIVYGPEKQYLYYARPMHFITIIIRMPNGHTYDYSYGY